MSVKIDPLLAYSVTVADCAEAIRSQELAAGKSERSDQYYLNKAKSLCSDLGITPPERSKYKNVEVAKKMSQQSNFGGRKRYTAAQKKAYYSGMGYAACMEGKAIPFKNEENKASFKAGYNKGKQQVKQYPNRRGGDK